MHKEIVYIKGYAKGKNLINTLKAINLAIKSHDGQFRKTGEPYVEHPMKITKHLLSLGLDSDNLLAAAMLHDTVEDCELTLMDISTKFNKEIKNSVKYLTKFQGMSTKSYYNGMTYDVDACLIKIADRCHNVSTMVEAFSKEKLREYIQETNDYVIPLCKRAVRMYPEYSDQVMVMRYHIESVCHALTICLDALEKAGE